MGLGDGRQLVGAAGSLWQKFALLRGDCALLSRDCFTCVNRPIPPSRSELKPSTQPGTRLNTARFTARSLPDSSGLVSAPCWYRGGHRATSAWARLRPC